MSCKCATYDPDEGRYTCSVSGDGCMYMIPNSKRCAEKYGEGPDAVTDRYELIIKSPANAYIMDKKENTIVALCSTKRPDLGFNKLMKLVNQANGKG